MTDQPAETQGHQRCTQQSGTCSRCRAACAEKPGWFLPGEAEKAAEHLGLTMKEFFDRHLAVDWWVTDEDDIFLLSPAVKGAPTGTEFPGDPHGTCVFFVNGQCSIHAVKPYECRDMWCGDAGSPLAHAATALAWEVYQEQIHDLLGRRPVATEYTGWQPW